MNDSNLRSVDNLLSKEPRGDPSTVPLSIPANTHKCPGVLTAGRSHTLRIVKNNSIHFTVISRKSQIIICFLAASSHRMLAKKGTCTLTLTLILILSLSLSPSPSPSPSLSLYRSKRVCITIMDP